VDNVIWAQLNYVTYHGKVGLKHENINARRLIDLVEECPDKSELSQYSDDDLEDIKRRVASARKRVRPVGDEGA
jgi:hypothetical protein